MEERNDNLRQLSQLVIQDGIHFKLDKIADVYMNGLLYFTVFRRYNSVYEYVIEYVNGDYYLQKDDTIRHSLQKVLCLSNEEMTKMYTLFAYSYKHQASIVTSTEDLADYTWSQIAKKYHAIGVNFGGILLDFQRTYDEPSTPPRKQVEPKAPNAPLRPAPIDLVKEEDKSPQNLVIDLALDKEPWSVLVPVPRSSRKRPREWACYCDYEDSESEEEEEEEEEQEEEEESEEEEEEEESEEEEEEEEEESEQEQEEDDDNYTILRSGLRLLKCGH
jgi:hypothetical protein